MYLPDNDPKAPDIGRGRVFVMGYSLGCRPPDGDFAALLRGVLLLAAG